MWVGLGGWEDRQDHDARRTRNGRVVTIPSAGAARPPTYPPIHPLPWPVSRHPWRRCSCRRGVRVHYEAGGAPLRFLRARQGGETNGRRRKRRREGQRKKSFCFLSLPHPAPRVPGSVVDKSRERLCGLGAAAVVYPEGKGATQGTKSPPVGRDRSSSLGVGGNVPHWAARDAIFVDGHPCGIWCVCAVIISPPCRSRILCTQTIYEAALPLTRKRGRQRAGRRGQASSRCPAAHGRDR